MSDKPESQQHTKRDGETFIALGIFIVVLALAVLSGTAFAHETHAMVVNAIAGIVLLAVGIGFTVRGWSFLRSL